MATQMEHARNGIITDAMRVVAEAEHQDAESIRERVARGVIAIPANVNIPKNIPSSNFFIFMCVNNKRINSHVQSLLKFLCNIYGVILYKNFYFANF